MTAVPEPSWDEVLDLVARLDAGSFDQARIRVGGISVELSKGAALPGPADPATPPTAAVVEAEPPAAATAAPVPPTEDERRTAPAASEGTAVPSPMVGIFYRSSAPGAAPYARIGDVVTADQIIGILEVMKMMNPVTAGISGRVVSFPVTDGEAVEFGQPIAHIEETG